MYRGRGRGRDAHRRVAGHGVGLAGARLAVGEDGPVVALQDRVGHLVSTLAEDGLLGGILQGAVELEGGALGLVVDDAGLKRAGGWAAEGGGLVSQRAQRGGTSPARSRRGKQREGRCKTPTPSDSRLTGLGQPPPYPLSSEAGTSPRMATARRGGGGRRQACVGAQGVPGGHHPESLATVPSSGRVNAPPPSFCRSR